MSPTFNETYPQFSPDGQWLAYTSDETGDAEVYVGATSESIGVAVVALCVSFGCTQVVDTPFGFATMAVSGRHAAVATGILNTGGAIPGAIGGIMVPVTASVFGWTAAVVSGSLFLLFAALLWPFIRADEPMGSRA